MMRLDVAQRKFGKVCQPCDLHRAVYFFLFFGLQKRLECTQQVFLSAVKPSGFEERAGINTRRL